ncbi:AAA family ATPase [Cohnella sp. AR92]|uniref:AAA family ATPase n=1 Tax=Cohnella sp. AR92 TaxID=648716 RepID=UPI000F8CF9F8|nr:AAA family ATPase [Cohnella sp. AR92]RUS43935.1 AAA family ATPase [Cohnella sp. AR92]
MIDEEYFEAKVRRNMFFLRIDEAKHYFTFFQIDIDVLIDDKWVAATFNRKIDHNGNWIVSLKDEKKEIILPFGKKIKMKKALYVPGGGFSYGREKKTHIIPISVFINHEDYRHLNTHLRKELASLLDVEKRLKINPAPPKEVNITLQNNKSEISKYNASLSSFTFDLEEELKDIIGLKKIKEFLRTLQAHIRVSKERVKFGLPVSNQTLHMVFTGNPGTGKTTIARVVSKMLYHLEALKANKLVEADRANLVAEYLGQTAIKTKEVFMSALDGVLFIDEAYALYQGNNDPYGKEAIDTLVKLMEDYREQIVVIIAGYEKEMSNLLKLNPGLSSRFPDQLQIHFTDYTSEELLEIALGYYKENQYIVTEKAKILIQRRLNQTKMQPDFGNGRAVRNLYEDSLRQQSLRLNNHPNLTKQLLLTITEDDIR